MKFKTHSFAAAALALSFGAHAQVDGALVVGSGTRSGTVVTLSEAGLGGGSVATLIGGTVYVEDKPFADVPAGALFGDNFLAAGLTAGSTATLSFSGSGVDYVSFLWGSPDTYNVLTVNTTAGSQSFTTTSLGFAVTNGDQETSQYVEFTSLAGSSITGLVFTNAPNRDAFEAANFSISAVSAVPEPETNALLLAGLAAVGYLSRRRSIL